MELPLLPPAPLRSPRSRLRSSAAPASPVPPAPEVLMATERLVPAGFPKRSRSRPACPAWGCCSSATLLPGLQWADEFWRSVRIRSARWSSSHLLLEHPYEGLVPLRGLFPSTPFIKSVFCAGLWARTVEVLGRFLGCAGVLQTESAAVQRAAPRSRTRLLNPSLLCPWRFALSRCSASGEFV